MTDSVEVKDLAHFRKYNQNKLVIALSNINSLRNKFKLRIKQKKCWHFVETKIDENVRDSQFKIYGFNYPIE